MTFGLLLQRSHSLYIKILCAYQGWRSPGPASVSRLALRPNFNGLGLGLGLGCSCLGLGLGLGGPAFVYRVSRTGLGLEAGLET